MKIIKLDSSVYNKISAGEVVERPASVVKELTENAIDAGATVIEIFVRNGGLDEITVRDNGCGIEKDDLKTAFLPHATSKIKTAEDLAAISTLGFRGEALPSIASVSMVLIRTKTEESDMGRFLKLRGGEVEDEGVVAINRGTEITVSNLFFNTPARLKFLKTAAGELSDVKTTVLKLIFANPEIAISLSDDRGTIYSSDGKGLGEAIRAIFSEDMWQNLLPLQFEKKGITVSGYASRSTYFKMNRTYQISIVNGRVCDNANITSAISTVSQQYLMKRNYPVTVLKIDLDPAEIDVNVHPTKAEVRFSDGNAVFSAVYHAIKEAVERDIVERRMQFESISDEAEQPISPIPSFDFGETSTSEPEKKQPSAFSFSPFAAGEEILQEESEMATAIKKRFQQMTEATETARKESSPVQSEFEETKDLYRVIGQVFGTFLLLEYREKFIIVDQHAAVERLRYDKLLQEFEKGDVAVQPLLIPMTVEVSPAEYQILEGKRSALAEIGIELIPFGSDRFKLTAIPQILHEVDLKELTKHLLSDLPEKEDSVIRERLAYAACRSSIKGNTYLTNEEIDELMTAYFKEGIPLQCPHGRPAYFAYTKKDLEKLFKRIV